MAGPTLATLQILASRQTVAMPVIHVQHPLVRHKVGLLRDKDISTKKFRELTGELGRLLAYEATADFPLEPTTIECWSGPAAIEQIAGRKVTIVPILRAGLGMLDGVLDMIPNAKVSVCLLYTSRCV